MKSEEEIRALIKTINDTEKSIKIDGMLELTDKAGHWLDALEWVLEDK